MYIDRVALRQKLFGLVGFYNADNPVYETLLPSLLTSRSGKYVNEEHPFLSVENLDQSIKNFSQFNYPTFSTTIRDNGGYTTGSKVEFNNVNYEYIAAAPSGPATLDPPDSNTWRVIDVFSDFLVKAVYKGIDEMMDAWINEKKVRTIIKSIYDKMLLFSGVANYRNIEKNGNQLVGLRIRMKKGENSLVAVINKLGHHFTNSFTASGQGTLTIYLFHSSQQSALYTFELEHTKAKSSIWTAWNIDNNILRYISDEYDAGGDFYICYKQSELQALAAEAYRFDYSFRDSGCRSCGSINEYYKQYSNFIDVCGFSIAENKLGPSDTLFNPADVSISFDNNYGLNLNISTKCDVSWLFFEDEYLVSQSLSLSIAVVLMREIAYGTRKGNNISNMIREQAKKELMQFREAKGTLTDRWHQSIKALQFDLSGLQEECFPCDDFKEDVIIGTFTLQ